MQHPQVDILVLSGYFTFFISHSFLFYYPIPNCYAQRNITSIIYKTYGILFLVWYMTLLWYMIFYYVLYYIVSGICIGGRFLEDCFYIYSRQIISAVATDA